MWGTCGCRTAGLTPRSDIYFTFAGVNVNRPGQMTLMRKVPASQQLDLWRIDQD